MISLVKQNRAKKGAEFLLRGGAVPMNDATIRKMHEKNEPSRAALSMEIPPPPHGSPRVTQIDDDEMKKIITRLKRNNTPDLAGWCHDLLFILYEDKAIKKPMNHLFLKIMNDQLPPRSHSAFHARRQIPVPKKGTDIRIVSWGNAITAVAFAYNLAISDTTFLEPHNLGCGARGSTNRATTVLQSVAAADEDSVVFCLDIAGAFPATDRALALKNLDEREELTSLRLAAFAAMREPTDVLIVDPKTRKVLHHDKFTNGLNAGCRLAAILFCNRLQPLLESAVKDTRVVSVLASWMT